MPKPPSPGSQGKARKPTTVGQKMTPPGLAKKPGGLPPGQAKKMDPMAAVTAGDRMGGRPAMPPGLANRPAGMAMPAGIANRTANAPGIPGSAAGARPPKPPKGPGEDDEIGGGQRAGKKAKVGSGQKAKAGKGAKANPFGKKAAPFKFGKNEMKEEMGERKPKGIPTSDKRGSKSLRGGNSKPSFLKKSGY